MGVRRNWKGGMSSWRGRICNFRRSVNQRYKLQILGLEADHMELRESVRDAQERKSQEGISTNSKSEHVPRDSRFMKQEWREEGNGLVQSPSVMDILRQGDVSSVEVVNESEESYTKQEVIEELKQQNYLLRNEIFQNNHRYETQIQKLNLYIDKLVMKQHENEGMKGRVSTLFNALTVSFIDFSNEKSQYQKKILEVLNEITLGKEREKGLRVSLERVSQELQILEEENQLLRRPFNH